VVMIISGGRVLFMDPSKKHLPVDDRASLNLSLNHVQQWVCSALERFMFSHLDSQVL
jgi:hypothetical protein